MFISIAIFQLLSQQGQGIFNLKIRRDRFSGEKTHPCNVPGCDKSYFDKCNLRRHQAEKHGRQKRVWNIPSYTHFASQNIGNNSEEIYGNSNSNDAASQELLEDDSETNDNSSNENVLALPPDTGRSGGGDDDLKGSDSEKSQEARQSANCFPERPEEY